MINKNNKLFWDEFADRYDKLVREEGDRWQKSIVNPFVFKLLGNFKGKIVLDAGCGNGYLSRIIAKTAKSVIGVDFTNKLLEKAKESSKDILNLSFLLSDLENLPLTNNSFDIILCNLVLINVENLEVVVNELARVLKGNGFIVVSITHPCFENPPYTPAIKNKKGETVAREVYRYFPTGLIVNTTEENQLHYHYLLSDYINIFSQAHLYLEKMIEPNNDEIIKNEEKNITPLFLLMKFKKVVK
ncbi:MAG: class I SAM-dependent methyltransferase [Patescibacteria group bacterium]|nr:class I SAM-dependent methyltransferase [Patescibacteria group bacterium]